MAVERSRVAAADRAELGGRKVPPAIGDHLPVSYTHLDVYKRQDERWELSEGSRIGRAERALQIGRGALQVERVHHVRSEQIGEDRTEHRRAEATTDAAEKGRARGRSAELFVWNGVLHRDHEDLHDAP